MIMKKPGKLLFLLFFLPAFLCHADPVPLVSSENGTLTIDFQTTVNEDEKVKGAFTNSATVRYERGGRIFLRLDGLLGRNCELSEYITELITHYDSDHVSRSVVKRCLLEGSYGRIIAPYPLRAASRNRTFSLLAEKEALAGAELKPENPVLDIVSNGEKAEPCFPLELGEFFYYYAITLDDISIEMFKYRKPRNSNTDGLIYRITHKNVSCLLLGDFDDPEGIENLLKLGDSVNLKTDIIKWPHHAHKFPNNEKTNEILRKMNEVIDPRYIIWQRHPTQKGFLEYIERFDFVDKFLSSDDTEIVVISFFRMETGFPEMGFMIAHFLPFG